jgi:hypothetical protein
MKVKNGETGVGKTEYRIYNMRIMGNGDVGIYEYMDVAVKFY